MSNEGLLTSDLPLLSWEVDRLGPKSYLDEAETSSAGRVVQ